MKRIEHIINKIHCADCLEFMKEMPDECVDIVITSPPYNFDAGSGLGCKYSYGFKLKGYKDNLRPENYFYKQKEAIEHLIRITKYDIFYNIQMIAGNKDSLFMLIGYFVNYLKEIVIWNKKTAEPAINENCLNSQFEFILIFSKNNKRKFDRCFFSKGMLSNVWDVGKNTEHINGFHAIMPKELIKIILMNFSNENDIILDPFLGSGTTIETCKLLHRNFIGIEINEKYCEIARDRLRQGVL